MKYRTVIWILLLTTLVCLSSAAPVWAQPFPVTTAPISPVFGTVGVPVNFSVALVSGPATTITQFQWNFGDGQIGYGPVTTHTYFAPGTYPVTLSASGPSGLVATGTTTATIAQPSLQVTSVVPGSTVAGTSLAFVGVNVGGPYSGSAGSPIVMTGAVNGAGTPQFQWDFGDGQIGAGVTVTHSYNAAGSYTVRLTVTDLANGQSGTATTTAVITAGGSVVSYPAGWNLVAGPVGTPFPQALGPLYTWRPGDTIYEMVRGSAGVQTGFGYWAFFPQAASVALSGASTEAASVNLPAGQCAMVGNPSATTAVVIRGADSALSWDGQAGQYKAVQALAPGAGAWVCSGGGATVTLSS